MTTFKGRAQMPCAVNAIAPAAPEDTSTGTSLVSERCQRLRELGPLVDAAFSDAILHEGGPAFPQLDAKYHDLETRYDRLAEEVWATPARSWLDIVERAELVYAYADEDLSESRDDSYAATRATAELVMAILALTDGEAWRRIKRRIK